MDVNTAPRERLLRIPGFGVKNVDKILLMRPYRKISLEDLGKLHIPLKRAKYFVTTSDHNPDVFLLDGEALKERLAPTEKQLSFFDVKPSVA